MKIYQFIGGALLLGSFGIPAQAESMHPQLDAKHMFILGGFRQSVDGEFYAKPDALDKATIDFDDLDIDDTNNSFMFEYRYRLNDKWLFTVGTYQFSTSGTIQGEREFEYDGEVFEAGARLKTDLDVDTYMLEAMYSVYKTDRAEILLGGGLHVFDFGAAIEVSVFVGDEERTAAKAGDDILAPLPNLRAQAFYALTPKWALAGALGWLSANYGDYEGAFTYVHARTMYRLSDRFGVGVGYQYVDVDLDVDRTHGEAGFDIQFSGPTAYVSYSF